MQSPQREAWARLPWRRWVGRGVLLGLAAALLVGVVALLDAREPLIARHAGLAVWWPAYVALSVAGFVAVAALLARWRYALPALATVQLAQFIAEAALIGWGPHLLRIPVVLGLAAWASHVRGPAGRAAANITPVA